MRSAVAWKRYFFDIGTSSLFAIESKSHRGRMISYTPLLMINLMSYASAKVSHISEEYAKSYACYFLRTQRATPVGSSPPERKPLRAPESYHHSTMGLQHIRRLTVLTVAPYLRHESSTWDLRQPLGVALVDVTPDHARSPLKVSPSNRLDSV